MKQKRKWVTAVFILSFTFLFAGCSSDDAALNEESGEFTEISEEYFTYVIAGAELEESIEEEESDDEEVDNELQADLLSDIQNVAAGTILSSKQIDDGNLSLYFASYEISDEIFARIYGDNKSYKTYCTVPREDLRYIKVLHWSFDSQIHVGELIIHRLLADEICEIFRILYENGYQINKMILVDDYNADDSASIADNNTSAFNFRYVTNGTSLSNHAFGCAIDINPLNNPYIWYENGILTWSDPDVELYLDRDAEDAAERHMINYDDLCYQLFTERGWTWGGDWANPIDYQHFEKAVATY